MAVFHGFLLENEILLWLRETLLKVAFCGEYSAKNHLNTMPREPAKKKTPLLLKWKKNELNHSSSHRFTSSAMPGRFCL